MDAQMEEDQWLQKWYSQLSLINKKRVAAIFHGQLYQQRMTQSYNKKVQSWQFKENDLVLKKVISNQDATKEKFAPKWEGLFIVKEALFGEAIKLQEMDGEKFLQLINSDSVKRYYVWIPYTGTSLSCEKTKKKRRK